MLPKRIEDSPYPPLYNVLMMDDIYDKEVEKEKNGLEYCDFTQKINGINVYNYNNQICAVKYNKDGVFHYQNSGGRFSTFAIQVTTYGKLDYRVYVSIDGVNWDDKVTTILYDYVDKDKFNVGHLDGGTLEVPITDVFYFHVIGRLHMKIEVKNSVGEYYLLALD